MELGGTERGEKVTRPEAGRPRQNGVKMKTYTQRCRIGRTSPTTQSTHGRYSPVSASLSDAACFCLESLSLRPLGVCEGLDFGGWQGLLQGTHSLPSFLSPGRAWTESKLSTHHIPSQHFSNRRIPQRPIKPHSARAPRTRSPTLDLTGESPLNRPSVYGPRRGSRRGLVEGRI